MAVHHPRASRLRSGCFILAAGRPGPGAEYSYPKGWKSPSPASGQRRSAPSWRKKASSAIPVSWPLVTRLRTTHVGNSWLLAQGCAAFSPLRQLWGRGRASPARKRAPSCSTKTPKTPHSASTSQKASSEDSSIPRWICGETENS